MGRGATATASSSGPLPLTPSVLPRPPPSARRLLIRRIALRIVVGAAAGTAAVLFVYWLGLRHVYDLPYAESVLPSLFQGFLITSELIAVVIPVGFALGFLIGWARTTRYVGLRAAGAVYVDFFRSMPPIVLIAFAFILGQILFRESLASYYQAQIAALWLGVLALGAHTAAYQAEIVRAGILSVPTGQTEAADAIGMSRRRSMFRVVLPQAFRVSLPALGNEFSSVIKDTSLLSVIGWLELSGISLVQVYSGIRVWVYAPIMIWIEAGIFYFVITFTLNSIVRAIENTYKVPGLEVARL